MNQRGFGLIEILISVAIISATIFAFTEVAARSVRLTRESVTMSQAGYLLEEGAEAVKLIRDGGWTQITSLTAGTPYYLLYSGGVWTLTTTANTIDAFTRTVQFANVSRDANDDIITTGGTNDPHTKKVTVTVSWTSAFGSTKSKVVELYITNISL